MTVPAAYRAISILATAASQLQIGVQREGRWIESPALIKAPAAFQTQAQFVKRVVIGLAGTGNAYLRIIRGADGLSVASVDVLDPMAVAVRYDDRGRKLYDYATGVGRELRTFKASEVRHLRLLEVPGHAYGLGPVQSCRASLGAALDLRDYAGEVFNDGTVPTGILTSDMQLTSAQADAYRDRWHATQARRDVAVLGQGLTYAPIILKPADAQFLESQQFSVTDVARLFGIPAAYLLAEVNGSSMTYQSLEMADTQFVRYTLMAYLGELEGALTELLPRGQFAKFRLDGLLRPDTLTRARVHQLYRQMGAMTVNEVRAAEGLDPIAGGDTATPAPAPPAPAPAQQQQEADQ